MKISNTNLLELQNAFNEFDERTDQGEVRYKVTWKATYAIARCKAALRPLVNAFNEARDAILATHADGKNRIEETHPKYQEFLKDVGALLKDEVDFEPHRFAIADLNPAANCYPPSLIQRILPLLAD